MKNIHILPTDKPSRLLINTCFDNNLELWDEIDVPKIKQDGCIQYYNIYITSDEEIKEGDWVYYSGQQLDFPIGVYKTLDNIKEKMSAPSVGGIGIRHHISEELMENGKKRITRAYLKIGYNIFQGENLKKIILTTDQELINDGVQAIDDEFLEWFVNNPSCEEVEVVEELNMNGKNGLDRARFIYKIIIPKEESKAQGYICPQTKNQCDDECCVSAEDCHIKASIGVLEEPKQETLEEASWKFNPLKKLDGEFLRAAFIKGAKWQAEKICTELDINHLEFIYARMIEVHNENPNYDYMLKFRKILKQLKNKS